MFHKVVWQHMQGVVGFLVTTYCKFVTEFFSKKFEKKSVRLRFERIMAMRLWLRFLAHSVKSTGKVAKNNDRQKMTDWKIRDKLLTEYKGVPCRLITGV